MNFKKKFDYNDINNFLPDNLTIGKSEYYQKKFNEMMPQYICDILEVNSRSEYDDVNKEDIIDTIKQNHKNEGLKL